MRISSLASLLLAIFISSGCNNSPNHPQPSPAWSIGFWFWTGSQASLTTGIEPIDYIYCHTGNFQDGTFRGKKNTWTINSFLPKVLPVARQYWLVFRSEGNGIPPLEVVSKLLQSVADLQAEANQRGLYIAGIQLDVDSPTRALPQYAALLHAVRNDLPPDLKLSITALIDWFRTGTAIRDVIQEVDEFVPQFYDVQNRDSYSGGSVVATPILGAKWGPVFNRYKKSFRVGISTFGRSRLVPKTPPADKDYRGISFADLKPLDVALLPAFHLEASKTEAQELVLRYRAVEQTRLGYTDFEPGDAIEFVASSPGAIRAAVKEVKVMGDYCAGVVFFRWPASNESLTAQPEEVLVAAGAVSAHERRDEIRVIDGGCSAVHCVDLYLVDTKPLAPTSTRYRIESTTPLEYFLPSEKIPIRMSGPLSIDLWLPPYCGRGRMFLGRAVSVKGATFSLKEQQ